MGIRTPVMVQVYVQPWQIIPTPSVGVARHGQPARNGNFNGNERSYSGDIRRCLIVTEPGDLIRPENGNICKNQSE
jgi:hypothetical protein